MTAEGKAIRIIRYRGMIMVLPAGTAAGQEKIIAAGMAVPGK